MYIYITVTKEMFIKEFADANRQDQFSIDALRALYDYFEYEYREPVELDVGGICCDFTEDTYDDVIANYDIDIIEEDGEPIDYEDVKEQVVEYLRNETLVVYTSDDKVLYQNF